MDRNENLFLETTLENWNDLFNLNQKYLSKFVFRGQANEKWGLSTSLERQINRLSPNLVDKYAIPIQENYMLKEFKWKYPLYSTQQPEDNNTVEWLTIMQHYGAATRLLDFSYSLFVALHMAVVDNGDTGALWAINTIPIGHHLFNQYHKETSKNVESQEKLDLYTLEKANEVVNNHSFEREIEKQLFIIKPKFCNERLARQQGLFLLPSDIKLPFSECLNTYLDSTESIKISFDNLVEYSHTGKYKQSDVSLIKIIIPKEMNYILTKNLKAMNVTSELLFPGLEGLAKSLNCAQFCLNHGEDE